ncbi:hypothetical protein BS50DRAFT_566955 [Corynespora cassiicola Philippines]|uniref:Chromatin assembly factor 1 subunit A n=1 Tax=Corynespora cassiicola Philippines TaxID=1448308 RepID=A0A2T2P9M1_CORCC|nr:hypothetical protein BS50DRAFT_566955 [Corynespora cassiicola Philippines]
MEDPIVALPTHQKRPHEEDTDALASGTSTPLTILSKTPSPVKSTTSKSATLAGSATASSQAVSAPASGNNQQPAKRRKLTAQEKEQQRLEKEAREKAKAEKKVQKELEDKLKAAQKVQKEEEKRQREEEKRKRTEDRESKKRAKEAEQQQKEEEKQKKERSQLRLNAFFVKPKPGAEAPSKALVDTQQDPCTQAISVVTEAPVAVTDPIPPSPQKTALKNAQTDYERYFLPFSLPSTAILAPYNAFMTDPDKRAAASARIDKIIAQEDVDMEPLDALSLKSRFSSRTGTISQSMSIVEIVERINVSSDIPIDLADKKSGDSQALLEHLKEIPMKYIQFPEDVRPPYYGTYTKKYTPIEASRLARNPFRRLRPDTDYDYDSEAEWEEPEEGEDLDSEGDEDMEEEDEGDMDGFIEDDQHMKHRLVTGDLQPVSTGLCWEDAEGVSKLNDGSGAISTEFRDFRMGFLLDPQPQSIDPFSTAYWAPEPTAAPTKSATSNGLMNPPRAPLTQRPLNGLLNTLSSNPTSPASKPAKAPKRQIPDECMAAFKAEVDGSDMTKLALIEALKKKFPKLPKDAITNTLTVVAKRVGPSASEKRWVLLS